MSYDKIIKDLEICGNGGACTGCSMEKRDREDCYRILMMTAAAALKERTQTAEFLLDRNKDLRDEVMQVRLSGINGIRAVFELIGAGGEQ